MPFFCFKIMLSGQLIYFAILPTDYTNWTGRRAVLCDAENRTYICDGIQWIDEALLTGGGGGGISAATATAIAQNVLNTDTNVMRKSTYDADNNDEIDTPRIENRVFVQAAPSALWTIIHNLNRNPTVVVTDASGNEIEGGVTYVNNNTLTVSFSPPQSGKAQLL